MARAEENNINSYAQLGQRIYKSRTRTTRFFLLFMINLLLKEPHMKWCTSRLVLGFLVGVVWFAAKRNVAWSKWEKIIYLRHFILQLNMVILIQLKREIQNVQMKPTNYLKFSLTVFFFVILTNKFIYSENQIYFRVKWKYLGKGQLQSKENVLSVKWSEDLWGHPIWNSPKF